MVGVLLAAALWKFFSVPMVPHGLGITGGLFVLGWLLGTVSAVYDVTEVEFTPQNVRLRSGARTRTVNVADLRGVQITHSGDTDSGYRSTSLQLTWHDERQKLDGVHDPTLASSLTRLLPRHVTVEEEWQELE